MDTKLAFETLSQIFNYLRNDQSSLLQLNRTCKKLYTLSCPFLYKSPQFSTKSSFQQFADTLTEANGKHVRYVDLHMIPHRWDSTNIYDLVCKITEKTPELDLLNLDLCAALSNKTLMKITRSLSDLRLLSLNQCENITDEGVEGVIKNCPYIQELYLGGTRITDNSLNIIATKLILLTHLYIPGCEYVTEMGINKVIRDRKTLKHIDCRECFNVVGHLERLPGQIEGEDDEILDGVLQHAVNVVNDDEDEDWTDLDESDAESEGA